MINRALLRTKIVQILYSYYKSDSKSLPVVEKELFHSIEKTYDLYFHLLNLSVEITRFATEKIETKRNRLRPTQEDLNPNTRFIDNRFVAQLSVNIQFDEFLSSHKLSWVNYPEIIKSLYEEIIASDFYAEYMDAETVDYAADKDVWRKIYKKVILQSQLLDESIEDQSIYWTDDIEMVVSFIIKTIKRFDAANGDEQPLLPMFKDEEDAEFATRLFRNVLAQGAKYREMIDANTKNWELDRIAFMDIVIMEVALAELLDFPTIPVNVTLNEYIEIAKTYSTDKSGTFINGVLDNIVGQLKKENKLIKVVMFTDNKK
ncbi:MAG TPA: transcription antitermination factor NusB [Paludibacter sp.]|nr:transcription antitermination factor NusB [Paludibacter sp.]